MFRLPQTGDLATTRAKLHAIWNDQGWPIADQGLISATNFISTILLVRALSLTDFGTFALMMTFVLMAGSVQSCLVTQPHNVLGVGLSLRQYQRYTTGTLFSQMGLIAVVVSLALVAATVSAMASPTYTMTFLALAWNATATQLQEFSRRALYTQERFRAAFLTNVFACAGQILGIVLLMQGIATVPAALVFVTFGSIAGAGCGFWQLRKSLTFSADWGALKQNWNYGKWLLVGEALGEWLATHVLLFLAAASAGAGAAGILRVMHTILGPARVLSQAFGSILPTQLKRILATHGAAAMKRYLYKVHCLAVPAFGAYCLAVAIFARPISNWVLGNEPTDYHRIFALYAAAAFVGHLAIIANAALRARQWTRAIFIAEVLSVPILFVGPLLASTFGISGMVIGLLASDFTLLLLLWRSYVVLADVETNLPVLVPTSSSMSKN